MKRNKEANKEMHGRRGRVALSPVTLEHVFHVSEETTRLLRTKEVVSLLCSVVLSLAIICRLDYRIAKVN